MDLEGIGQEYVSKKSFGLVTFEAIDGTKVKATIKRYNEDTGVIENKNTLTVDEQLFFDLVEKKRELISNRDRVTKQCNDFISDLNAEITGLQVLIDDLKSAVNK